MPKNATTHGPNVWVVRHDGRFTIKEEGRPGYLVPALPQRR